MSKVLSEINNPQDSKILTNSESSSVSDRFPYSSRSCLGPPATSSSGSFPEQGHCRAVPRCAHPPGRDVRISVARHRHHRCAGRPTESADRPGFTVRRHRGAASRGGVGRTGPESVSGRPGRRGRPAHSRNAQRRVAGNDGTGPNSEPVAVSSFRPVGSQVRSAISVRIWRTQSLRSFGNDGRSQRNMRPSRAVRLVCRDACSSQIERQIQPGRRRN
jgi:hypothetical protein